LRLIASLIRYMRYKSLTSARQEGTCRFGPKDWVGLPDGEYLFSIDTGSIESGADASDRPPDGLRLPPSSGAADAHLLRRIAPLMASDGLPHQVRPTRPYCVGSPP
jgi:hypothetical protein